MLTISVSIGCDNGGRGGIDFHEYREPVAPRENTDLSVPVSFSV